ncbi:ribonuclease H-like domain-containing protein [Paenibacillus aurantius]|uniref:Ribonuclease H-like domain-containing protein n=1 Tax=Paenibacillus aurantius TaxID=2918900 RepID=A0AA96L8T3_9BACL|nr:ribonuclease H-like domain-containing protein [Paenibacillus aurantius]WNQ09141.1 ribonuclease H-like domain-containing protein [Paenibacillus aurantius]
MSGLKDRLNRLKRTTAEQKPAVRTEALGGDWEQLQAVMEINDWGSFIKRSCRYPLTHKHGKHRLGDLHEYADGLQAFHPGFPVHPECLLFLDTETTGLGVGAGNVPFMLGLGFYQEEEFVVEQLFIRNPAEEMAMLAYVQSIIGRFTHLVSYNGRTFDWPLVKNRYVLNRMELDDSLRHLDFLYPSRSLWRHTMPSCRLGKVEEQHLAFNRTEDVPGSLAPTLYFEYLAEHDPKVMEGVFVHNEHDILSLAGLAVHFSRALAGELPYFLMVEEEVFRLGLWLDRMGQHEHASEVFGHLLDRPEEASAGYWVQIAASFKKRGEERKAVELWTKAADFQKGHSLHSLEPLVELAMFYEHKRKDFGTALYYAEEALSQAWTRSRLSRGTAKQRSQLEQLNKRVDRLRLKRDKAMGKTSPKEPSHPTLF